MVSRLMLSFKMAIIIATVFLLTCGKNHNPVSNADTGKLEVRLQILSENLEKTSSTLQTKFDSLIIQISGSEMATTRLVSKVDGSRPVIIDTIPNLAEGTVNVKLWTVDKKGVVIHVDSLESHAVQILSGKVSSVTATLLPAAGSIYLQIGSIPGDVDTVSAVFVSSGKIWSSQVKRDSKVFLSLDNIPNNTTGTLTVYGIRVENTKIDTPWVASKSFTLDVTKKGIVNLVFQYNPAGLELVLSIKPPEATLVSGKMSTSVEDTGELGTVLITEIMYAVDDSEYIELYNPASVPITFDSLKIVRDDSIRTITNVTFAPNGYYTIGRRVLPWINVALSPLAVLDLSPSSGNWISVLSNNKVLDKVAFMAGSNELEWPNVSGKRSIILDSTAYNAEMNNYGRYWHSASVLIKNSTTQYGSPGLY